MTFYDLRTDSLAVRGESSNDGGKTWKLESQYQMQRRRVKAPSWIAPLTLSTSKSTIVIAAMALLAGCQSKQSTQSEAVLCARRSFVISANTPKGPTRRACVSAINRPQVPMATRSRRCSTPSHRSYAAAREGLVSFRRDARLTTCACAADPNRPIQRRRPALRRCACPCGGSS
jgi:hypothetical protein